MDRLISRLGEYLEIAPFKIDITSAALEDLHRRLAVTRLSDAVMNDWQYGTSIGELQEILERWLQYDWLARQNELNALPQYRAIIDGFGIHFMHFRGTGSASREAKIARATQWQPWRIAPFLATRVVRLLSVGERAVGPDEIPIDDAKRSAYSMT